MVTGGSAEPGGEAAAGRAPWPGLAAGLRAREDLALQGVTDLGLSECDLLRTIIASSPAALAVVDGEGILHLWNPAATKLYGWDADEVLGGRPPFIDAGSDADYDRRRALVMAGASFVEFEATRRRKDGTGIEISVSMVPLSSRDGKVVAVLCRPVDLTEQRQAEAALAHQATHDALTGLRNRTGFLEAVTDEMDRPSTRAVLVYLALDDFKDVIEVRGRRVGFQVLRQFAEHLRGAVRSRDVVGRLGGGHFAVLLTDTSPRGASAVAKRLLHVTGGRYTVDGQDLAVQASAGMAPCRRTESAEDALDQAERAMRHAQRTARGGLAIFDRAMHQALMERVGLAEDLRAALAADALAVHYQPILSLCSERLVGVEALARWFHPRHGWVPPDRFVPLAEQTGTIGRLGHWVLDQAVAQLCRWQADHPGELTESLVMSVNLSAAQLHDPGLVADVAGILGAHGLPAHRLTLEVTETALTRDFAAAQRTLRCLRALGVELAIDDFGTGNSSFTLLREMPFGMLKIDRSFVDGIGTDRQDTAIVASTLDLAGCLGLVTLAEGVETPDQLRYLTEHGCAQAQGYLIGRPVPPDTMGPLLSGEQHPLTGRHRALSPGGHGPREPRGPIAGAGGRVR